MKTIALVILTFLSYNLKADCLSCWELYKVEIELKNGDIVKGYITWNDSWINNLEIRKASIDAKVKYQLKNANWYKLTVYHDIIELGEHLPCRGIISSNRIDTLLLSDFNRIDETPPKEKRPIGAGWVQNYSKESIGAESFFLNYNTEISLEDLEQISNDRDFWYKRKSYEKMKIVGLFISWGLKNGY